MYTKHHVLYGFLFAFILYFFFEFNILTCLIIFLSSFLFDVDHYLDYVFKKKDFNLRKAYLWNFKKGLRWISLSKQEKRTFQIPVFIFHGIEFLIFLFLLSYFHVFFFWVFLGVLFHGILDLIFTFYTSSLWYSKASEIYIFIRNKNKKEFDVPFKIK